MVLSKSRGVVAKGDGLTRRERSKGLTAAPGKGKGKGPIKEVKKQNRAKQKNGSRKRKANGREGQAPARKQEGSEIDQSKDSTKSQKRNARRKLAKKREGKTGMQTLPDTSKQELEQKGKRGKTKKRNLKASEIKDARCKNGHIMQKRETNPKAYLHRACCDVCGLANLAKKETFFFHCSFCRWDLCAGCVMKQKQGKPKDDKENKEDKQRQQATKDPDKVIAERQLLIPTEEAAVNRAPTKITLISTWAEGVPL